MLTPRANPEDGAGLLLLVTALLSPRLQALMILKEPETSLHPDLLPPPGRLIAKASKRAQIVFVSHAATPVLALKARGAGEAVMNWEPGETAGADIGALLEELADAVSCAFAAHGHFTSGGSDIRIASMLPPVIRPNLVPRSCSRLNST